MPGKTFHHRTILRPYFLAALFLLFSFATHAAPPNILVVLTDDQGWGDASFQGNPILKTPVLDQLARDGAVLEHFYVSPVCAPTRAAFLTGRYALRTGVSGVTRREETMRTEEVTIAEVLKGAGYATGCFGKWHNGAQYPFNARGQGFDEFLGFSAGHWNNYFDTTLDHNGTPVQTTGYINDVVTDAAVDYIEANAGQPYFCYVAYNTPHSPFQAPDNYFDHYKSLGLDDTLACVYAMCASLDDCLGRLLAAVDETGKARDTVVIFFGDNGPNTERFNGGLRGRKGQVHEGGVRNIGVLRYPRKVAAGTRIEEVTAHIDLLPTLAEWAGASTTGTLPLDGVSLAPLLEGRETIWPKRMLYSQWAKRGAVRTESHRYVNENGKEMLFDLETDPRQEKDIAAENPEATALLAEAYAHWHSNATKAGLTPPPIPVGLAEAPRVTFPGHEALLTGCSYTMRQGWANDWITNWSSEENVARWPVEVSRAGAYEVSALYACTEGDVGSTLTISAQGKSVAHTFVAAAPAEQVPSPDRVERKEVYERHWQRLDLGVLHLKSGAAPLELRVGPVGTACTVEVKGVEINAASDSSG